MSLEILHLPNSFAGFDPALELPSDELVSDPMSESTNFRNLVATKCAYAAGAAANLTQFQSQSECGYHIIIKHFMIFVMINLYRKYLDLKKWSVSES